MWYWAASSLTDSPVGLDLLAAPFLPAVLIIGMFRLPVFLFYGYYKSPMTAADAIGSIVFSIGVMIAVTWACWHSWRKPLMWAGYGVVGILALIFGALGVLHFHSPTAVNGKRQWISAEDKKQLWVGYCCIAVPLVSSAVGSFFRSGGSLTSLLIFKWDDPVGQVLEIIALLFFMPGAVVGLYYLILSVWPYPIFLVFAVFVLPSPQAISFWNVSPMAKVLSIVFFLFITFAFAVRIKNNPNRKLAGSAVIGFLFWMFSLPKRLFSNKPHVEVMDEEERKASVDKDEEKGKENEGQPTMDNANKTQTAFERTMAEIRRRYPEAVDIFGSFPTSGNWVDSVIAQIGYKFREKELEGLLKLVRQAEQLWAASAGSMNQKAAAYEAHDNLRWAEQRFTSGQSAKDKKKEKDDEAELRRLQRERQQLEEQVKIAELKAKKTQYEKKDEQIRKPPISPDPKSREQKKAEAIRACKEEWEQERLKCKGDDDCIQRIDSIYGDRLSRIMEDM
jgi:hypothetical protein